MDFDPRDFDSRDDERHSDTLGRGGSGDRERDEDWSQPAIHPGERDDDDARSLGRGGGGDRQNAEEPSRDVRDDAKWPERDREA